MRKVIRNIGLITINLITLSRLLGALALIFIYYNKGISMTINIIIILFLTDLLDGFLARKFNLSTFFGSILDASCDKILNFVAFIILGLEYNIMFCPLVIEIFILYTIYSTYRNGGNIQSSKIGKIKTIILDLCVILSFILLGLPTLKVNLIYKDSIINMLGIITLIFCIITLYDYMKKNIEARKNPKCMEIKYSNKKRKPINIILDQLFDTNYYKKYKDESILKLLYL